MTIAPWPDYSGQYPVYQPPHCDAFVVMAALHNELQLLRAEISKLADAIKDLRKEES